MTQPQGSHRGEPEGTPMWVKVFIVLVVVVSLALAVTLIFGLQHGPGMHGPTTSIAAH